MKMRKDIVSAFVVSVVILLSLIGLAIKLGLRSKQVAVVELKKSTPVPVVEEDNTSFSDRVQESLKGTVHLSCPQWQGSGFVIGPRLIVTARHCVEGVEEFVITTYGGHKLRATRAISDKKHDVAFIWVDDLTCIANEQGMRSHKIRLHPLKCGSIKNCVLGESVYVIGSPYGQINFNSLTTGIISGVDRDWSRLGEHYGWEVAFTVDAAGHPGNSGCPVFSMDGTVRGILVGGFSPVLISVMPCDLFLSDLEEIEMMFTLDKYRREETVYMPYSLGDIVESEDVGQEGRDG